jgi:hypothetical protein
MAWSDNVSFVSPERLAEKLDLPIAAVHMWRTNMNYMRFGGAICMGCGRYIKPHSHHCCFEDGSYYTITYDLMRSTNIPYELTRGNNESHNNHGN